MISEEAVEAGQGKGSGMAFGLTCTTGRQGIKTNCFQHGFLRKGRILPDSVRNLYVQVRIPGTVYLGMIINRNFPRT